MARRVAVARELPRAICGEAAVSPRQEEQSEPATPLSVNHLVPEMRETYEMQLDLGSDSPDSTH